MVSAAKQPISPPEYPIVVIPSADEAEAAIRAMLAAIQRAGKGEPSGAQICDHNKEPIFEVIFDFGTLEEHEESLS